MPLKFELKNENEIIIKDEEGKNRGHIFSPSGSGWDKENAIQICGFSEAFDLWGCAVYKGKKDIQLLFDDQKMKGELSHMGRCIRCYMSPCQCENKRDIITEEVVHITNGCPFNLKREKHIKDRIKYKSGEKHLDIDDLEMEKLCNSR